MILRVRRMLLGVLIAGTIGTAAELMLTGHTEEVWQQLPIGLLAAAVPVAAIVAIRPLRGAVTLLQILMVIFIAAGLLGAYFHYHGNAEFARELTPGLAGFDLLKEAMTRQTPPPLAPGTMILLGLIGLICCYGENTK